MTERETTKHDHIKLLYLHRSEAVKRLNGVRRMLITHSIATIFFSVVTWELDSKYLKHLLLAYFIITVLGGVYYMLGCRYLNFFIREINKAEKED